jgi:hypothetical protein
MTEPEAPEPRPPDEHGLVPDDHPIIDELRRAGEIVRRINAHRRNRDREQ